MQQNDSKCFDCRPAPTPDTGDEVNRSKVNFSEHGHFAYQSKGLTIFCCRPSDPFDPWWGAKRLITIFSEYGHVVYKIEGIHICSNMIEIFCRHTMVNRVNR